MNKYMRGFTLIELMVVIVILGLLVGIIGPNVLGVLGQSEHEIATMQMKRMGDAVELYQLQTRHLPDNLDVLTEVDAQTGQALLKDIPRDPWRSEYGYTPYVQQRRYQIQCSGRDRQADTDDDLFHPTPDR